MKNRDAFDLAALQLVDTAFNHMPSWTERESKLTLLKLAWCIYHLDNNSNWLIAIAEACQYATLRNLQELAERKHTTFYNRFAVQETISEGVLIRAKLVWDTWQARYNKE